MKYNELNVTANKSRKRVGRGISAGGGKTAGRGTKGQNSRTGKKLRTTFMGGQRSLVQAIPKNKGFKSLRVPAQVVYSGELDNLKSAKVDNFALFEAGLIATPYHAVKVISKGETKSKAIFEIAGMSQSVAKQIESNGGRFIKTAVPTKPSSKKKDEK
jgi:large subunit ribosomal protein L15